MTTKYYRDEAGNYLGAYGGINPVIPAGAIEVSHPPQHGRDKWDGEAWVSVEEPSYRVAKLTIVERLIAAGKAEAAQAALNANAALSLMWNSAPETVPHDRADIRQFLTAIGADPDVILTREA